MKIFKVLKKENQINYSGWKPGQKYPAGQGICALDPKGGYVLVPTIVVGKTQSMDMVEETVFRTRKNAISS